MHVWCLQKSEGVGALTPDLQMVLIPCERWQLNVDPLKDQLFLANEAPILQFPCGFYFIQKLNRLDTKVPPCFQPAFSKHVVY